MYIFPPWSVLQTCLSAGVARQQGFKGGQCLKSDTEEVTNTSKNSLFQKLGRVFAPLQGCQDKTLSCVSV